MTQDDANYYIKPLKREFKFRIWSPAKEKFLQEYWFSYPTTEPNKDRLAFTWEDSEEVAGADLIGAVLQQFTGLTDDNKTEIYEGDIVKVDFKKIGEQICVVEYVAPSFVLTLKSSLKPNSIPMELGWSGVNKIEVIGNIFELDNEKTNQANETI